MCAGSGGHALKTETQTETPIHLMVSNIPVSANHHTRFLPAMGTSSRFSSRKLRPNSSAAKLPATNATNFATCHIKQHTCSTRHQWSVCMLQPRPCPQASTVLSVTEHCFEVLPQKKPPANKHQRPRRARLGKSGGAATHQCDQGRRELSHILDCGLVASIQPVTHTTCMPFLGGADANILIMGPLVAADG